MLRAGGALAFGVWSTPDRNPWAAVPGMTLVQLGHVPPPEPGAPGIFAMGDADRTLDTIRVANLTRVMARDFDSGPFDVRKAVEVLSRGNLPQVDRQFVRREQVRLTRLHPEQRNPLGGNRRDVIA